MMVGRIEVLPHAFENLAGPAFRSDISAEAGVLGTLGDDLHGWDARDILDVDSGHDVPIMGRHAMFSDHHTFRQVGGAEREACVAQSDFRRFVKLTVAVAGKLGDVFILRPSGLSFGGREIDAGGIGREHAHRRVNTTGEGQGQGEGKGAEECVHSQDARDTLLCC